MEAPISFRQFGVLPGGEPVEAWTLRGRGGVVLEAITLGGIVTSLLVPDRNGLEGDVVLGFDNLDSYAAGHPYFGAITGRTAGRIAGAAFELEGHRYTLACNDPPNHLHGGEGGFDKCVWSSATVTRGDGAPSLRLTYHSPDGEDGYPGVVDVAVTYTVLNDNTFLIESEAVSDRVTPFNLTHHSYFNLKDDGSGTIHDHRLAVFSDRVVPAGEHLTLTGRFEAVGPNNDFRQSRRLGDAIPGLFKQHGDLYALESGAPGQMKIAARLEDDASGRVMTVATTNSFVQLYSGRYLDVVRPGKSGVCYGPFAGLCLECENYPDASNAELREGILLRPGETQRHATSYRFSTQEESTGARMRHRE